MENRLLAAMKLKLLLDDRHKKMGFYGNSD
jgi:hypothetical protein